MFVAADVTAPNAARPLPILSAGALAALTSWFMSHAIRRPRSPSCRADARRDHGSL